MAAARETLRTGAPVAYRGDAEFAERRAAPRGKPVVIGPDSVALETRPDPETPAVVEVLPDSLVRGRAIAIVMPPTRWRRLP